MNLDAIEQKAKNQIAHCTSMMAGGVPVLPEPYAIMHSLAQDVLDLVREIRQGNQYLDFVLSSKELDMPNTKCLELIRNILESRAN